MPNRFLAEPLSQCRLCHARLRRNIEILFLTNPCEKAELSEAEAARIIAPLMLEWLEEGCDHRLSLVGKKKRST